MKRLRTAAAVLNQTPMDWEGNTGRIIDAIREAREESVSVLCLPELCLTGYGCEDMFLSSHVWEMSWQMLQKVVPETSGMIVTVGLPLFVTNGVYNAVCVIADGEIAGFVAKQHLAGDGLHYEPRWFRPWPTDVRSEVTVDGQTYPIGDVLFECDGVRFGFEICEDAWVATRPGNRMAASGVDVILNPSASHFAFGKHQIRRRFVLEGSRAFGVTYIYANLVGNEAGRAIYDGGALIASDGQLVATGPRFSFSESAIVVADVDVELTRSRRAAIHSMAANVTDDVRRKIVSIPGSLTSPTDEVELCHNTDEDEKPDEFTQAISLGLFDYMRKSFSRGFVVSMSGGADSSAVACLIRCMAERAVAELGLDGVCSRLSYFDALAECSNVDELMKHLLIGVYQATRNSGEVTRNAAEVVTCELGGAFHHLDIEELSSGYTKIVEGALGRSLTWDTDDIALQNIQARTRAPSVWMFANVTGGLLVSTSNRSEAAVGYATMDGDTAGGLSPIAGIDKAFLREWLRKMETDGTGFCSAVPALKLVNEQQPTAELRPAEFAQTDESDLMPYPILDEIESYAIGDRQAPAQVLERLHNNHPDIERATCEEWVRRFFSLWCRNQWKRERYAPSFHVDDKNLDPRTWCRFPILSGGYRFELSQLQVAKP